MTREYGLTISNNAQLFDEVLQVFNNHQNEPGVVEALEDLKAAKVNYVQRSIDYMMNCLVLAIHDLFENPPSKYEASGGKPLSHDDSLDSLMARLPRPQHEHTTRTSG